MEDILQIAGLIARRIVCETNSGQELNQGDRIGMIRFGSRADGVSHCLLILAITPISLALVFLSRNITFSESKLSIEYKT